MDSMFKFNNQGPVIVKLAAEPKNPIKFEECGPGRGPQLLGRQLNLEDYRAPSVDTLEYVENYIQTPRT